MPFLNRISGRIIRSDSETVTVEYGNKKVQAFRVDPNAEVTTQAFEPMDLLGLKHGQVVDISYRV